MVRLLSNYFREEATKLVADFEIKDKCKIVLCNYNKEIFSE